MILWMDLTRLVKIGSAMFFQSVPYINQQLLSGNYSILLQHYSSSLNNWHDQFISQSASKSKIASKQRTIVNSDVLHSDTRRTRFFASNRIPLSQGVHECTIHSSSSAKSTFTGVVCFGDLDRDGLEPCILPQDQKFIRDVVTDSGTVLEVATAMHSKGRLRYAPLRIIVCITSSSIFLLKAISLGARNSDLQVSLGTLDRCIAALRSSGTDDMDFSLRYAALIESMWHDFERISFYLIRHQPRILAILI